MSALPLKARLIERANCPKHGNLEAGTARRAGSSRNPRGDPRLHRQQTLALQFLARELAGAAERFRLLSGSLFGWFFVVATKLHLAKNTFALHLLLERSECLVDIVIPDENLHVSFLPKPAVQGLGGIGNAHQGIKAAN
jgi:hypothetical protein